MTNPADEPIVTLIDDLCDEVRRCVFDHEAPKRQTLINQIAQLRASMNCHEPVSTQEILDRR